MNPFLFLRFQVWKLLGLATKPKNYPYNVYLHSNGSTFALVNADGRYLVPERFTSIEYDKISCRFACSLGKTAWLVSTLGAIIYKTGRLKVPGHDIITQDLKPSGNGGFYLVSKNHLANNGWRILLDRNGNVAGEMEHFWGGDTVESPVAIA